MANRRILICGLPGSGKTTLARHLSSALSCAWIDGDYLRERVDDWDFSPQGRVRQAERMRRACDNYEGLVIASFVCPTEETREAFAPDLTIHMDTVKKSRFPDTDMIFQPPKIVAERVTRFHQPYEIHQLAERVRMMVPQGMMIGRFQPWHDGHTALFKETLERSGYVGIGIRSIQTSPGSPYTHAEVVHRIHAALKRYAGCYHAYFVPDVRGVYYGRDVGYAVEHIELPPEIEAIRATDIRAKKKEPRHA